jgi:hypothetical protein
VPAALAGLGDLAGTRVVLAPLRSMPRRLVRACPSLARATGAMPAAFRLTRLGSSLSVLDRARGAVYGCDGLPPPRSTRWCGATVGRLAHGRLLDPRLDLCGGGRHARLAFAWLQPLPRARWLVVRDGRLGDVYEARGRVPVRIVVGRGIDLARASARLRVRQYDQLGGRLAESDLEARVSG